LPKNTRNLVLLGSGGDILAEQELENRADEGLNEEQLAQHGEGEVEAHQLEEIGQQGQQAEAGVVRIVQECGDEAHGGAHQADGGADDGGFKHHRVVALGVENAAGQLEGAGGAHEKLKAVGQHELQYHHGPNGAHAAQHINAALGIDRGENAVFAGDFHQGSAVDHIKAVENIGVHRDDNGKKRENHSLKLIAGHFTFPLFPKKRKKIHVRTQDSKSE